MNSENSMPISHSFHNHFPLLADVIDGFKRLNQFLNISGTDLTTAHAQKPQRAY